MQTPITAAPAGGGLPGGFSGGTAGIVFLRKGVFPIMEENGPKTGGSLVSVITPVYNKERYLDACIGSVLGQTYPGWELILVDDCSADASFEILQGYARKDPRIRCERLARNAGAAAARNRALSLARGRYVAFLDADDIWMPDKLARQVDFLSRRGAGFCYTAIEMIGDDGAPRKGKRPVREVVDYRYLLTNTVIACSSVLIDRKIIGDFRMPDVRKGQDYATWLAILRRGFKAYGIDEALVRYRIAKDSVSSNKLAALRRTWHIYRRVHGLGFFRSLGCFALYTFHAVKKYFF